MSDFQGMEELLQDFLQEAGDMLSDVDNKLMDLEKNPSDKEMLNCIFRGFHTIKGGAGFLNATEMVKLCHLTENLFDKLRNGEIQLTPELMDVIMAATAVVREMFGSLSQALQPAPADATVIEALEAALRGESIVKAAAQPAVAAGGKEPDWNGLYHTLVGGESQAGAAQAESPKTSAAAELTQNAESLKSKSQSKPTEIKPQVEVKDSTIRIDTTRLDQVLNLSGEIGLTKNRLTCLRSDILHGKKDIDTLRALDEAVSQLDLLVGDLQNAVMKTRMQPIGRLFQKYPRLARDLARQLGKDIELEILGEETELDKTMIEDLSDPLVHLVRNAVDHGVEMPDERRAQSKPEKCVIRLSAEQVGDHIVIEISDDGRGMRPDVLRRKAVEKGLIDEETANSLDDRSSLQLVFLPGFSTKDQISSVSGRGVGMDVVKTNIQKLNGRIEINSAVGEGSTFTIYLPLTLAILPVLVVRLGEQSFAVPLAMVREIIPIVPGQVQAVSGRATMVVRDEVLPVRSLAQMLDWPQAGIPAYGVLMQSTISNFVLAVDGFVGRDDVVMKSLDDIRPKGIAGATLSGDGSVVLVLDMEELLQQANLETRAALFAKAA